MAWALAAACFATSLWIGGHQPGCDVFFALMGAAWLAIAHEAGTAVPKSGETPAKELGDCAHSQV